MTHKELIANIKTQFINDQNWMLNDDTQLWGGTRGMPIRKTLCEIIITNNSRREIIRISSRLSNAENIVSDLRIDLLIIDFPAANNEVKTYDSKFTIIYDNSADTSKNAADVNFIVSILKERHSFLRLRYID